MAYTPTPPTVDPSQKGPVLSGANDVPYVGKPKPGIPPTMPPGGTNRPPQKPRYGSSDGSGFNLQAYLAGNRRPRPVQVLPGQGVGPMPVGTRPLPNPVVKDGRGGVTYGGGMTAINRDARINPDGSVSTRNDYNGWDPWNPGDPGGPPMGGDHLNPGPFPPGRNMGAGGVDPSTGVWTPPSDKYMRGLEGGQIAPKWAGAPGSKEYEGWLNSDQRKARLEKSGLFSAGGGQPPWLVGKVLPWDIGPGSANERAQAALRAEWEAKNGPWQGGPTLSTGDNRLNRGDMGPSWNDQERMTPLPPGYDMQKLINAGNMGNMKPGGVGPGGQDPMYGGAGTGPSYGGPTQARDFNVPNYGAPVQRGPMQGPPPVGTGPGSMGKPQQPGAPTQMPGRQPLRPGMEYRPGGGQRPVYGGGMQAPPGMDPNIWAGMDEETKRRWMGMAGGGGMQPMLPNEQNQAQMPNIGGWDPRMGSGYYGAF